MSYRFLVLPRWMPGAFCLLTLFASRVFAVDEPSDGSPVPADGSTSPGLAATQEAIEMRYRRFSQTLVQLSEYLRKTDPARAELLLRASGKSIQGRIPDQLKFSTDFLKKDQLGDAVERQELVITELQSLLELLMSEARKDDLEREKKRIQDLIKDVNKLIGKETDARADTERGGNSAELQNQQKQVADSTGKLLEKIESQDAAKKANREKGADSPGKPGNKDENEAPSDEPKTGDKEDAEPDKTANPPMTNKDGKAGKPGGKDSSKIPKTSPGDDQNPKSGEEKKPTTEEDPGDKKSEKTPDESEPKPGDSPKSAEPRKGKPQPGKPQKGKPKPGKPQEGQPQEQQPPQEGQEQPDDENQGQEDENSPQKKSEKTAGRDELERAKQEMNRAIEELKKNNKKNASDKQDKAIAELMKAKEKLEEILRQLREEERELVLAQLEARFRDMLLKQELVNNGTLAIHAVPDDKRTDRHRNRAVELARNEEEISLLAAKALTLLKEEGSSVAFPEAVEQIRDDMITVARRLERVDIGEITQNIEQDVAEGLKEIIEAMQKELEKLKDKKQQQQQQQEQQQQQQGLVNKLAELKMLRSLQYRVNRRTKQLGRLVDGEQAVDTDVVGQLKQLSDRQSKVQRATYDLSTGKNQ